MKRIAEAQMKKNIKLVPSEFYHLKYKVSTGKHEKFSGNFFLFEIFVKSKPLLFI